MNVIFPVIELIDRLAIAEVKWARTQRNQEELEWYQQQSKKFDLEQVQTLYQDLVRIHNQIWDLEAELKSGREHEIDLAEIGRRAIAIRNHNNQRIAIKNAIADQLGCAVREIKQDHASE